MLKYLQEATDDLTDLRTGMHENATQWVGMPVTTAQVDAAISAIKSKNDEIEAAENTLQQRRAEGRLLVGQYNPLISQITNLATGLHADHTEKLGSYGIDQPKAASPVPPPGKAVVASVTDDTDGIGFIVTLQPLPNADTFEIEKAVAADATAGPGPFVFYKSSKKLKLVDDDVEKGRRYYYRARAMNRNGSGEWSEPVGAIQ